MGRQELADLSGRVPAARCDVTHLGSLATLLKAGMGMCGHMMGGRIGGGPAGEPSA